MWAYESVFYQVYPLGFTGAPFYKKSFRALNCPEALNLLFFIILLTV